MAPKIKITKDDIIDAAIKIARKNGAEAINARSIAAFLNCSTQPIFTNFNSMEELYLAVVTKADILCNNYMIREVESGVYPPYKANGMAYIRFAKEEKELFKLLYMRDRSGEAIPNEQDSFNQMTALINNNTGLCGDTAKLFHLEMWAYVHGIATMFATGFLDLEWELVSRMLTDSYQGLAKYFKAEQ